MSNKNAAPQSLRTIEGANASALSTDLQGTHDDNYLQEQDCILILRAFILDNQIEHPDQILIVNGEKHMFLSEIFASNPSLRQKMIGERAEVFRQLGIEAPIANGEGA